MKHQNSIAGINRGLLFLMAAAISATAANLYYNQPLLPSIAESLGIASENLGLIPMSTQVGYAAAIFFISPLGDRYDRKQLIRYLSLTLIAGLVATYFASSLVFLLIAGLIVGLSSNITQQIIPLASSLIAPEDRGKVISTLMTGLTVGILLSRTISGTISEHFGWRAVYLFAAALAVIFGLLLAFYLPKTKPTSNLSYPKLLASMLDLLKKYSVLRDAALVGGLWFAVFNALWATLAIHVMDSPFNYSVQQAGMFGLIALAGTLGAKVSGRLVNRYGANKLIAAGLLFILSGFVVFALWGDTLAGLIVGIILVDLGVFGSQVPNQVRIFSLDPKAQSRINAIYMLCYYLGGAVGSAIGVHVIAVGGWIALTLFGLVIIVLALIYHLMRSRKQAISANH
ncbi:MFS transporter [Marinomonas pollencensis]|uniref:Putative MFS family arabinose efflux permease n=1 Tax=Marinomonas pollencensis TaxID=491954 RepID=A0A3E0DKV8_9GAMM|nr:MFS transporter [Marinomonas pollencensis]REG82702.1 putative MFS family arabinose efflux permease [Marinomonas pollencensis]